MKRRRGRNEGARRGIKGTEVSKGNYVDINKYAQMMIPESSGTVNVSVLFLSREKWTRRSPLLARKVETMKKISATLRRG